MHSLKDDTEDEMLDENEMKRVTNDVSTARVPLDV
jgi:hypothetical protein